MIGPGGARLSRQVFIFLPLPQLQTRWMILQSVEMHPLKRNSAQLDKHAHLLETYNAVHYSLMVFAGACHKLGICRCHLDYLETVLLQYWWQKQREYVQHTMPSTPAF